MLLPTVQSTQVPVSSPSRALLQRSLADDLLVSLRHDHLVRIPEGCRGVLVSVVVELRSVGQRGLAVSVEAIDRRSPPTAAAASATAVAAAAAAAVPASAVSSSGIAGVAGASYAVNGLGDAGKVSRPLPKGLRWESKTKFVGIEIAPYGTVQLIFKAMITRPGIFDLKRLATIFCSINFCSSFSVRLTSQAIHLLTLT